MLICVDGARTVVLTGQTAECAIEVAVHAPEGPSTLMVLGTLRKCAGIHRVVREQNES